ncbi:MAG: Na+/H+ antiporter NhaA [Gemmataceae bacterium]
MKLPEWLPDQHHPTRPDHEPEPLRFETWLIYRYLHTEAAGGIALLACTLVALVLANTAWAEPFDQFWQTKFGFTAGSFELIKPLRLWINDGLMTIFFFLVGLEIKREFVFGELRDPRQAALPVAAALGGMLVPAGIYLLVLGDQPGTRGWGIPMATDIAFVVGFLALLGRRVTLSLKILLLTLAIVDDIGAVLVIALAYTSAIALWPLAAGGVGILVIRVMRKLGLRSVPLYWLVGAIAWLGFLKSGIHPTVAGVVLGLLTPATPLFARGSLAAVSAGIALQLDSESEGERHEEAVALLRRTATETLSPLDRLETALHPWVAFGIMPLFALANAGVTFEAGALASPAAQAVAAGLIVGKPVGILLFSAVALLLGIARLPGDLNWRALIGGACLTGIGFTMSLFISGLALEGELLTAGKIGTLAGSAVSAALALAILVWRPARE